MWCPRQKERQVQRLGSEERNVSGRLRRSVCLEQECWRGGLVWDKKTHVRREAEVTHRQAQEFRLGFVVAS